METTKEKLYFNLWTARVIMYLIESQVAQSSVCIDCYILRVKLNAFSITFYGFLVAVLWENKWTVRYYGQNRSKAAELFSKIQAHHWR